MRTWSSAPEGQVSAANVRWASTAAATASEARAKRRHDAVALALLDRSNATMAGDDLVQDLVVPGDRNGHRRRGVLPPLRRRLDVGEQERDRARRQREASRVRTAHFVHQETPDRRIDLTHDHGVSIRDLDHRDIPHLVDLALPLLAIASSPTLLSWGSRVTTRRAAISTFGMT